MSYLSRPLSSIPSLSLGRLKHARRLVLAAALTLLTLLAIPEARAGYSALVVDAASGRVLYARNPDTRNYPASLTKMMTLYLLFEAIDQGKMSLSSRFPVSPRAAAQPPSKLGMGVGTTLTADQCIRALVTRSANDVAVVVAEALAGSESAFAARMTAKARALGMTNTTFRNASGLPNPGQTSSARDMVMLGLALLRHHPKYYHYFGITSFRFGERTITTHNHVLQRYPGADGLKTGYIAASGFNVVSSAVRNGNRLMAAVFGGRTALERDTHMISLLDQGFAELNRPGRAEAPVVAMVSPKRAGAVPMGSADDAPAPGTKPQKADKKAPKALKPAAKPQKTDKRPSAAEIAAAPPPPFTAPPPSAKGQQVAMVTPPAPPRSQTGPTPGSGTWGIQVGAYGSSDAASASANDARAFLKGSLKRTLTPAVLPHTAASGPVYRARVMGLSTQNEAKAACKAMSRANRSCLVVLPSGASMVPR
ncbi:D-alanyl-D-alanine carboxypeptidase [Pararhodospirillum photometricum]|uniref:Serine-type D-Ala-D-Ala carboxypeptidase n=1 Tax=Pararhodospirillum photometricum DSM 122 TaxID=1150469 RepID=H6SJK2_PARPM|nr:D-alanyl-D-alanine carboxypeptidase [Pararhodospirillum photometricum]CCG08167.1 Serine-type D-Ala-D-Ala carboxypeptidase [Pararhodospirillum photometricum DSM 122]